MSVILSPATLCGTLPAIPSKSDAHRVLTCAALATRPVTLTMRRRSADINATLNCLAALGATVTSTNEAVAVAPLTMPTASPILDCGECGTTLRFLLPVAAALGCNATFRGHGRLPARPIGELTDTLRAHGVVCSARMLPLTLAGRLTEGEFAIAGDVSSQYISGLLLALPLMSGAGSVRLTTPPESVGYIDMTRRTMARFGVNIEEIANGYAWDGVSRYETPAAVSIEGDWSNSAFWLAAGALGGPVTVTGLSAASKQGDRAILPLLQRFGAAVQQTDKGVTVSHASLHGIDIDLRDIPDLLPPLAVVAAAAQGTTRLHHASRARLKECDRLAAMARLLRTLGAAVEEWEDELCIHGGRPLHGGEVDGENDHRIVMAAALTAMLTDTPVTVSGEEAVGKSYPAFFADYQELGGITHVVPVW